MAWLPFKVWWRRVGNQQDFWRTYDNGVAISLGETPRYIFRQILQRLKEYHDQNVGYGNLLEGVLIGGNNQVKLRNYGRPNPDIRLAQRLASIREDMLDFKKLFTWVEHRIYEAQLVRPAYSSRKFHELFMLLDVDHYNSTVDGLRRVGFFIRNNPLFYDDAAKFLFFRKVLTILEYGETNFHINVKLLDLQDWSQDVRNPHLISVKNFRTRNPGRTRGSANTPTNFLHIFGILQDFFVNSLKSGFRKLGKICNLAATRGNPTSQSGNATSQSGMRTRPRRITYGEPDGSILFFRNCLGHLREHFPGARYHDAKILLALEDNLPKVIPVWFFELVCELDSNIQKCMGMCDGYRWMEFLSMQPSVFT